MFICKEKIIYDVGDDDGGGDGGYDIEARGA